MQRFLRVFGFVSFCCLAHVTLKAQTITEGTASGTIYACLGSPSSSPNIQQFTVNGSGLTTDITASAPTNFEVSLSENSGYAANVTLAQTNGKVNGIVYIRAAATAGLGGISGKVVLTSAPAVSKSVDVSGTVKALPTVNTVGSQTKNNGEKTNLTQFTGTSQLYRWTNDSPEIGLAASGTGDIPSFTAINTTNTPVVAKIIVTPEPTGFVYAANQNGNSVSIINFGTNKVAATIPVGAGPAETLVSPDGTRVYVANQNGKTISVIDATGNTFLTSIDVGQAPVDMAITPDGSKLFICNAGSSSVSVIGTAGNNIVATIPVGSSPQCSALSSDGTNFYVSSYDRISAINTANNTVKYLMLPTPFITGIALNADGSRLYASSQTSNAVLVINTVTNTVIKSIPAGNNPYLCLDLHPVGTYLYVANNGSNTVTAINTNTNTVAATIPVGAYCISVAMSPDRQYVYASARSSGTVSVISTATNNVIATIPLSGIALDDIVISPDGSRVYVTDNGANAVHVINTATNTVIAKVAAGIDPRLRYTSISKGNGCSGLPKTFTITVNAAVPVINTSGVPSAVSTTYGTPSPTSSFVISGKNMAQGITVTPPAGFEISTDGINFSKTLTIGAAGDIAETTIYARLAGTTNAGPYSGDFVLTSPGAAEVRVPIAESIVSPREIDIFGSADKIYGDAIADATLYYNTPGFVYADPGLQNGNTFYSLHFAFTDGYAATAPAGTYSHAVVVSAFDGRDGFLASNYNIVYTLGDVVVEPAPLTITAKPVNKPYGTALNNVAASTDFTVTGLKNGETIGSVNISYGSGAAATDPAGLYTGSIAISAATGGTFNPANYDIHYVPADITVNGAPVPAITVTSLPSPVNTIYGTPSGASSFTISGSTLPTGITVTPPPGFEVSTDNINFGPSVIAGAAGTVNATIYIRLTATTDAGPYNGPITLTSGATQATVAMPVSIVSPAPLTIAGINETKTYGTALQNYTGPGKYTITAGSLKNGNTISTISISYGPGAAAGAPVGTYSGSVMPGAVTGGNGFKASNYAIIFSNADIIVLPANLTVTADNQTRDYGADNPVLTYTYSGFVNGDTEAQLATPPTTSTTATEASQPGKYPISISGAASPNYTFVYIGGVLTVNALPNAILVVPNTFTPNGDGINDTWNLPALLAYPNCTVNIYDRYGQMVFRSIGYAIPWDGRYNSKNVPTGVYYYIIDRKNNTAAVSGSLTVLR